MGGSNERRLTLGTNSEAARREWAFSLMLATKWGVDHSGSGGGAKGTSSARDSLSYVNELKKQQSFQVPMNGRNSLQSGDTLLSSDMKKQSITVDMRLQDEDEDPTARLKLAASAAASAKLKRRTGRISTKDIIKETDETRQEDISMLENNRDEDEEEKLSSRKHSKRTKSNKSKNS
jgi:hypothetical protein